MVAHREGRGRPISDFENSMVNIICPGYMVGPCLKKKERGKKYTKIVNQFTALVYNLQKLTVSKLPLCIKSIGGRNRSARVVSFLSIAPPFLNSCSCLTAIQKDGKSFN